MNREDEIKVEKLQRKILSLNKEKIEKLRLQEEE
jgi:hypothetical protein|tara:strand:+ start:313 stop:414 length:102 start_codon:yes stop_codon:yes gene_type:complete